MIAGLARISAHRALGDLLALRHHDHRVAEPADQVHVVLDDEEGVAELAVHALDIGGEVLQQRAVDAGRHLVEQHHLGIDHHGAAELEQLLLAAGEIAGELVLDVRRASRKSMTSLAFCRTSRSRARDRARREPGARAGSRPAGRPAPPSGSRAPSCWRIHARSGRCAACRGANSSWGGSPVTSWPSKMICAAVGRDVAGDEVEQRRFAGAVRADQPGDRAAGMSTETPSTARMPPKCMWRSSTRIIAAPKVGPARPGPAAAVSARTRASRPCCP